MNKKRERERERERVIGLWMMTMVKGTNFGYHHLLLILWLLLYKKYTKIKDQRKETKKEALHADAQTLDSTKTIFYHTRSMDNVKRLCQ